MINEYYYRGMKYHVTKLPWWNNPITYPYTLYYLKKGNEIDGYRFKVFLDTYNKDGEISYSDVETGDALEIAVGYILSWYHGSYENR